jgi:hypothetical protein
MHRSIHVQDFGMKPKVLDRPLVVPSKGGSYAGACQDGKGSNLSRITTEDEFSEPSFRFLTLPVVCAGLGESAVLTVPNV